MPCTAAVAERHATLPADWPHHEASRFVRAGGLRWHVQVFGTPSAAHPAVLLLHGTGASSHSWRGLAPLLAAHYTVIAPDLPGHAYTARPIASSALGLPGMAAAVGALLKVMGVQPVAVVGHSAGAAIAARLCLDGHAAPSVLVSLNGAWLPPGGVGGWLYSPLAKMLVLNPVVPYFFAWHASRPAMLHRLLASTGSRIDAEGSELYRQLVASPAHVGAVLAMMAAWDLNPLVADLPRLAPALHLVTAANDSTVTAEVATAVQQRLPAARIHVLPGLGHLAHEESPVTVARLLKRLLAGAGAAHARED